MGCDVSKKRRGGPVPKLTDDARKSIVASVLAGVPRRFAAARVGVRERCLYNWLAKGRRLADRKTLSDQERLYVQLVQGVEKAEADAVARNVGLVQRAAAERDEVTVKETVDDTGKVVERITTTRRVFDWRAAVWWLECRYPDLFTGGRREIRELRDQLAALLKAVPSGSTNPAAPQPRPPVPTVGGDARPDAV
jgi:hypothetical protein